MTKEKIPLLITTYNKSSKDFYKEVADRVVNKTKSLPNKFLFIGHQGASLWWQIDSKYKASEDGAELIRKNFAKINETIKKGTPNESYDIISLGVGMGTDDVEILKQIQVVNKGLMTSFNIYAIDLSTRLLADGVRNICDFVNGMDAEKELQDNINLVRGIWVDFEELSVIKSKLKLNVDLGKHKSLYHLLGLTLGNNDESVLLKSIYELMNVGDFLLLGVDFCVSFDDKAIIDKAEAVYTDGAAKDAIKQFMLSPLHFVSTYKKGNREKFHNIDNPLGKVAIDHRRETSSLFSKIDNAISFTRYHTFEHGERLCDYSTKYEEIGFKDYITTKLRLENVFFEWKECFKAEKTNENTQVLILLQKEPIKNIEKKPKEATDKEKRQAIKKLNTFSKTQAGESDTIHKMIAYCNNTTTPVECIKKINSDTTFSVIKQYFKDNKLL